MFVLSSWTSTKMTSTLLMSIWHMRLTLVPVFLLDMEWNIGFPWLTVTGVTTVTWWYLQLLALQGGSRHTVYSYSVRDCRCVQVKRATFIRNVYSAANHLLKSYCVRVEVEYEHSCRRCDLGDVDLHLSALVCQSYAAGNTWLWSTKKRLHYVCDSQCSHIASCTRLLVT